MLTLLTATPRTGKTLYVVSEILHPALLADELRPIYCDIKGFKSNVVKQPPADWRDCPDGSLIILDEIQNNKRWHRSNKKEDQMITDLSTHGHRMIDIVIITQSPRYLNADVLGIVGEHLHLQNKFNSKKGCKVYVHRTAQTNPNSKMTCLSAEDSFSYRYKTEYYDTYVSAVGHNKKFRVPAKIVSVILTFIIALFIGAYFLHQVKDKPIDVATEPTDFQKQQQEAIANIDAGKPVPAKPVQSPAPQSQRPQPVDLEQSRVAMVIQSSGKCRAFNSYGELLHIPDEQCNDYSDNPFMISSARPRSTPAPAPAPVPVPQQPEQPVIQPANFVSKL